jgi:hypothetical protein
VTRMGLRFKPGVGKTGAGTACGFGWGTGWGTETGSPSNICSGAKSDSQCGGRGLELRALVALLWRGDSARCVAVPQPARITARLKKHKPDFITQELCE